MFLSPRVGLQNRRRMSHMARDTERLHQLEKRSHRSGRCDPYYARRGELRVDVADRIAVVRPRLSDLFARVTIQHRKRLLAPVQITTDTSHLALLRLEPCEGGHRTVSGRCEADVVMTSICSRTPGTSRYQRTAKPLKNQQDAVPALSYEPRGRSFESCMARTFS